MSELRLDARLAAPPDEVWAALASDGLVGGGVRRSEEPGRRMVLAWREGGVDSEVEILLSEDGLGTSLSLVHRGAAPSTLPALRARWDELLLWRLPDRVRRRPRRSGWWVFAAALAAVGLAAALVLVLVLRAGPRTDAPASTAAPLPTAPVVPGDVSTPAWSPDGRYLASVIEGDGRRALWIGPVGSPDAVEVTGPPTPTSIVGAPALMREGYLLFAGAAEGGATRLWYRPVRGGRPAEVLAPSTLPGALSTPRYAPHGGAVTFLHHHDGDTDLVVYDLANGALRRVTDWPSAHTDLAWRPSRTWVVFSGGLGADPDLWEVPADGGPARLVLDGPGVQDRPAVTADESVWCASTAPDGPRSLVRVTVDGEREVIATALRGGPATTADGAVVAWTVAAPGRDDEVVVHRVSDGWETRVDTDWTGVDEPALAWRGDDLVLAFTGLAPDGSRRLGTRDLPALRPDR